jgi:hypothetical protein
MLHCSERVCFFESCAGRPAPSLVPLASRSSASVRDGRLGDLSGGKNAVLVTKLPMGLSTFAAGLPAQL